MYIVANIKEGVKEYKDILEIHSIDEESAFLSSITFPKKKCTFIDVKELEKLEVFKTLKKAQEVINNE